jgi:hypothetical protein
MMAARRQDLLTDWQSRLPATIDAAAARLPANYEAAKNALEQCVRIDEVKTWSDKASALATYAREANDKSLHVMAQRIHLRAVARIGELLLQIPASKGGHTAGRSTAAREAGLSSRSTTKALAIGRIPRRARDAAIEADPPPSVRSLEALAPRSEHVPAHLFRASSEFYRALSRYNGSLFSFCAWLQHMPMPGAAGELDEAERARVLERIGEAKQWLAELERSVLVRRFA